jgi:hypothetical protein
MLPAAEKITLVLEGIGDDKIRNHLVPGISGCFLAIACAVIGDESMERARIDMKLRRLAGVLQRGLHFVHLLHLNASVVRAVESEDRFFDFSRQLDRVLAILAVNTMAAQVAKAPMKCRHIIPSLYALHEATNFLISHAGADEEGRHGH